MPLTREEIEERRAAAMAAGAAGTAAPRPGAAQPNQSRLTLARAAIRPEMKGRVMLSGPPGAGKTYTGLVIATILVGPAGRILVIDSEKESSLTYADVFEFEHLRWNPPYDPTALSLTLREAQATYDCIIIDSFSHFWRKQGGVLDIAGDNVRGWKAARPIQENLIETLLDVDCHVIVCCRSKMDHLIEQKDGKTVVTKAGIKAQQDDDLEYEVNVALELDMPHVLHIVKSRTNAVPVGAQFLAGMAGDFAQQYRDWLASGEPVASKEATDELAARFDEIADVGRRTAAKQAFLAWFGRPEFLLVSRLPEAQQWVIDAVAGTLPVERGEDETPPEGAGGDDDPDGTDTPPAPPAARRPAASSASGENGATPPAADAGASSSPDSGAGTGQSATVTQMVDELEADLMSGAAARMGAAAAASGARYDETAAAVAEKLGSTGNTIDELGAPHEDSVEHRPDVDGPAVFNGDTGYCAECGAPAWFSIEAPAFTDGGPPGRWLHADPVEYGPDHPVLAVITDAATAAPAAEGWHAEHAPKVLTATQVLAQIERMTPFQINEAARAAGLPMEGSPRALKARYLEHRLAGARAEAER